MRIVSLKWKMTAAFTLLALLLVAVYVPVARRSFAADKISFLLETQQSSVNALAKNFDAQISRIIFDARTVAAGEAEASTVFWKHPQLLAVSFKAKMLEKTPGLLQSVGQMNPAPGYPLIEALPEDRYALAIAEGNGEILRAIFESKNLFEATVRGQAAALTDATKILRKNIEKSSIDPVLQATAQKLGDDRNAITGRETVDGVDYLSAGARLAFGSLRIVSLTKESDTLAAVDALFRRSIFFVLFSFFASVTVAVWIAQNFVRNVQAVTEASEKIGRGDFSSTPESSATDESGALTTAFRKMSADVKAQLSASDQKARRTFYEETTRLMQQNLFPASSYYGNAQVRLSGVYHPSADGGGDWWFYYQRDSELYVMVAEANAHGTDAALVTAAARAVFSYLQDEQKDLKQIMRHWDKAVSQCSNGEVSMAAFLMKINVELGDCRFINARHEPVILLRKNGGRFKAEFLQGHRNPALGTMNPNWNEDLLQLEPEDRLVLFTDGLWSIENAEGQVYNVKSLPALLEKTLSPDLAPEFFGVMLERYFMEIAGDRPLTEDFTIVTVDYRATSLRNRS